MYSRDSIPVMSSQTRSTKPNQLSLETSALEIAYNQACGHVERICESEKARHLQLQILLLENENNELYNQLAQADGRIDDLENFASGEQLERETALGQIDSVHMELRIKNREVETLKAELTSLCGIKTDSTKLLTEKLNLARELSNMKPELDHLRSQNSAFQSLLSEKLSLQRQLSTMQVEIENERRSKQRMNQKEGQSNIEDGHSEASLEAVKAELAKEKREKCNADREAQKSLAGLQNKITMYESRLDAFRGKLKSTKESLKEVQSELRKYQTANEPSKTLPQANSRAWNAQKRTASEIDADTMLGTPGDVGPGKNKKAKLTALGEKSTFSITPFLSRTASLGPKSPSAEGRINDQHKASGAIASPSPEETLKPQGPPQAMNIAVSERALLKEEDKALGSTGDDLEKSTSRKPSLRKPPKKVVASPNLPQVAEEAEVNFAAVTGNATRKSQRAAPVSDDINDGLEKKKVKRKILGGSLGKTLFDEDEGDGLKGEKSIGAARAFMKQKRRGLGEVDANQESVGGFGPFSPLKKDRRL